MREVASSKVLLVRGSLACDITSSTSTSDNIFDEFVALCGRVRWKGKLCTSDTAKPSTRALSTGLGLEVVITFKRDKCR